MTRDKKITLTQKKYKQLKDEHDELLTIGRKLIADKLDQYREDGRNEDDSMFSELLQEKVLMEKRIEEIDEILENAEITDENQVCDIIGVGCDITLEKDGTTRSMKIVSGIEADPDENKVSEDSPVGKAVIGKKVGDEVDIETPIGTQSYKVVKVQ
ncbi:GreA/GreB family elongation factor [Candidatus Dojkabacteria bacterium]|nr:GreA/GreB family elongation factor [Candidatus Dojkabacteria bacterium]